MYVLFTTAKQNLSLNDKFVSPQNTSNKVDGNVSHFIAASGEKETQEKDQAVGVFKVDLE